MPVNILYPGADAFRAAGIEKQRFNEAVAARNYTCAPEVRKGGTRNFYEDDIVALFIYARLTEQRNPPRVAGEIACEVRKKLQENRGVREVRIPLTTEEGEVPSVDGTAPEGDYEVHMHMTFDIAGIRKAIGTVLKQKREGL